jgi:putative ABC transport system permease protein
MRQLRVAFARIAGVFAGSSADDDLREELRSHVELETAENIRRGMPPEEAHRQALLASGGLTQAVEAVRDQRGLPRLESIVADIRYALRALRRSPGFTAVVVTTLALGIGANTAIFSVVRGVLLKPLPHRDGDRLVYLRHSREGAGGENITFSVPEVRDLRTGAPSLAGIAEYSSWSVIHQGSEGAERIRVGLVTGNYFEVMGLSTVIGRPTGRSDDGPDAPPVAILTHEFWVKRFGGDPAIVGRQLTLDRRPVTVIGILQPAPFFPEQVDALLNMVNSDHHVGASMVEERTHRMTEVVARLAPGTTLEQARAQLAGVYARLHRNYPEAYDPESRYRVTLTPFKSVLGERARLTLWLLMGAAAFVLIISAANVANLTLMRGVRREHELVVRAALGAGAARLRRLLLAESLVLTILGAILGIAVAVSGIGLLTSLAERYSPRASEIRLDVVVLAFALTLSVLLAALLSFIAWLPKEGTLAVAISTGVRRASGGLRKQRLQRALVVVQVAVSVVLLAGAGLLTRTLIRLAEVDTGLTTEQVLTMYVPLLTRADRSNPAAEAVAKEQYEHMRRELAALPGVVDVGVGSAPLRPSEVVWEVKAEGGAPAAGSDPPRAEVRSANPEFFRAAGIPLLQGRPFASTDGLVSPGVVIINQTLATRLFPHENPLGRRIAWTGDILRLYPSSGDWRAIVGVAGDIRHGEPDAAPRPAVYVPLAQMEQLGGSLAIRADSNVAGLAAAATRIVRRIAPTAPIENVMTLAQYRDQALSPRRLNAVLVSSFGMLAVIIAAVGIAGVLGFSVSARTNEIGIRMSLGADPGRVERMILGEGVVLLAGGLVLGVAGAFFAVRVVKGLLFGVAPHDPSTFIGVAVLMAAIGVVACLVPALRAARIDPAIAMRAE